MARTSPCFYIAPTAISVSPNANGSASDIAVNVVRGAKIKVYSPGVPALGYSDVSFQQWTLTGRNRRLADNTKPYSIYARLAKSNKEDGYLVFAPKVASGTEWLDKYAYVTVGGLATGTANKNSEDYWYVKLGDVSLPTNNARAVTLDTGILGTDKFNTDWNIDPDQMPLRIELSATIDAKDAGDKPYVEWDKVLTLKANLLEGWANANVQRFHHFTIQRNTGNELSDKTYNYPDETSDSENPSSGRKMTNGSIELSHARGTGDVFNGTVSSIWTVIAWGLKANVADSTSSSSSTSGTVTANVYEKLAEKSINIMAETGEQYALEMSSSVVNYDPSSKTYNPANGIDVMVRATDQRGEVFKLTNAQLGAANLFVQYSLEHPQLWSECDFKGAATAVAKANIPIKVFDSQQNVNVRIVKAHDLEIYRSHIAFIRSGEDGSAYDIYLSASVLKGDSTGKLNGNDAVSVTAKVVKITGGTAVQVTDKSEAYFTISRTDDRGDLTDWPSGSFTVKTFEAFGQGVKTWNFALYVGGTFLKTVMLPVVRDGKQGADGKGALEIICDPETIVLDTDDNGLVNDTSNAWAALMCVRDGKVVDGVTYDINKTDKNSTVNCDATVNNNGIVTITSVTSQTVAIDGSTVTVSSTSGSVTVSVTEKATGVTYTKTVPFAVNVARYTGGLKADNKKLQSQYSLLTNDGKVTNLTEYKSEILQTAKEISLKVSEKSVGRRNMLVGSACRKYGDGFAYMSGSETQYYYGYPLEQIEINNGMDGVNCIHCRTKRTGTDDYYLSGFRWWGISPQGNIKLEKGKNYVLSFYAKTPTPNYIAFVAEVLYQGSKTDTSRPNEYNGPTPHSTTFYASEADKWELFTVKVSMPSNAPYEYVEINIFARSMVDSFVDGYICKPMLEEGDEYNGWTLSEQDYDYVGGNILDGTGTLTKTGNVELLDETGVKQGGYNNESACVKALLLPTAQFYDFLQYSTAKMGLEAGEDYMLSFYARAASGYAHGELQCYLYDPSTGNVVTESSHEKINGVRNPADGNLGTQITLTTAWKRYWVHWTPMGNVPKHVLFRLVRPGTDKRSYDSSTSYDVDDVVLYGGTYYRCIKAGRGNTPSSSSSYWEATVFAIELARPKLEVGATMTEWTEKRTDMVDKRALFATGIDIENKKITLTADNTKFRGNDGKELAVIDQDGLRSSKIATTDTGHGHTVIEGNSTVWFQKDGKTPGIAVFYDAAGVPHLAFYGTDGKQKYDIGPSGLQSLISSIQQAHSDTAYLRDATSVVHTNNSTLKGFEWLYVASGQKTDKRYIYRKQIPMTDASAQSGIYDGCVFTKEYSGTNWPNGGNLLANGWYAKPNDGNLPIKLHMADEEGVLDPTKTLYYQTFYYYEGGKVARTVRAYMRRSTKSDQLVSKFEYAMSYDEIL